MSDQSGSEAVFGSDVKRLPLKDLVKRIGPGLIATGIVIGPGAVTTASMLGANYGYALIWLVIPIIFMGITFMMVTNRLAIVTGMPSIHAIRKYYGPVASGVVSVAVFLACLFFTMGNISGTGAVSADGKVWTARSIDGSVLEPGAVVRVTDIRGVKLIVSPQGLEPAE